jgi:hypothetical protein
MPPKPQIQDTGEKLGGARKDEESFGDIGRVAAAIPLLDKLWPAPKNWRDLLETKSPEEVVRTMVIRGNLAKGPHPDGYFKKSAEYWETQYRTSLQALILALSLDATNNQLQLTSEHYAELVKKEGLTDRDNSLAQVAIGRAYKRTVKHPFALSPIDRMRYKYLATMGWAEDERIPNDFSYGAIKLIRRKDRSTFWQAVDAISGAWAHLSKIEHKTEQAAVAEAIELTQIWLSKENKEKEAKKATPWKWTRPSSDSEWHRHAPTPDSTGRRPEDLIERFKIRGIEFGNWVPQAERQEIIDMTYDALNDLVEIFGMADPFASLGGKLGFAFGSRGTGLGGGAAHFEPGKWIIHLTRKTGAGSIAHEFGHALDHYIAYRSFGLKEKGLFTEGSSSRNYASSTAFLGRSEKPSDQAVLTAMHAWHQKIHAYRDFSTFIRDAYSMDSRLTGYWGSDCEIFARCFEVYIYDALGKKSQHNDYLVFGVDSDRQRERVKLGIPTIYPMEEERAELYTGIENIVTACRESWSKKSVKAIGEG